MLYSSFRAGGKVLQCLLPILAGLVVTPATGQEQALSFERVELDAGLTGGYDVTVADIDGDGLRDVVALSYRPSALRWYRNPDWQAAPLDSGSDGLINVAPADIDGDGAMDLALASEFDLGNPDGGGLVSWLRNPRGQDEETAAADAVEADSESGSGWLASEIDRIPTSHRLRWADLSGTGSPVLVNLPIIGRGAQPPRYDAGAELTAYTPGSGPAGDWGHVVLDDSLEMAHALEVVDWDGDGRDDLLTGSFRGVDLFSFATNGRFVSQETLIPATYTERPAAGVSEVGTGEHAGGRRFVATIEPWHGNEVVVYEPDQQRPGEWQRTVVDDSLASGHALAVADLDGDGTDEVVAGGRGEPHALNIYRFHTPSGMWRRTVLDRDMATSAVVIEDLNGDQRPDIVAVGASTANVVVYLNGE